MPSAQYDLYYLAGILPDLESYLLSNDLYWPVHTAQPAGEPPYPQLTPGAVLLAERRLQASAQAPAEQSERLGLTIRLDQLRTQWGSAWERKARQDLSARLRMWRDYLEEYRERPAANADRYAYEVTRRAQIRLLEPDANRLPDAERDMLNGLDKVLRSVLVTGPFVWEDRLQPAFPSDTFWYLYGGLRNDLPDQT